MKRHYNQPMIQIVVIPHISLLLSGSSRDNLPEGDCLNDGGGSNGNARSRGFDFFDD